MISSGIDPKLAAKQMSTQDMVRFKSEMDGLKKRLAGDGENTQAQLKKACENFEAVFIGKLWQQMKSTVPKEGYLHSKQEDSYMAMFDREFSEKMAQAGGIGLADMIYEQLSEKLKETSKSTLTGKVDIRPLVAQPMALNPAPGGIELPGKPKGMTLEDWGGASSGGTGMVSGAEVSEPSEALAAGLTGDTGGRPVMNDVDVKARLDALARRLEAQRMRDGLLGNGATAKPGGYESETDVDNAETIGRKLAEIG